MKALQFFNTSGIKTSMTQCNNAEGELLSTATPLTTEITRTLNQFRKCMSCMGIAVQRPLAMGINKLQLTYEHSRLIHNTSTVRQGYINLPIVSVIPNMRDVQQIRFANLLIKHFTFW
jgi:hypothetical protein